MFRSAFGFMAFHGGSLEVGTDQIAVRAAARAGASLYTVALPPDLQWHIPSKFVIPEHSAGLARFLDHVDVVVTVHGYGRPDRFTTLLLGGGNRELAAHLAGPLRQHLPDYEIVADLNLVPVELQGLHPDNPVNRPPNGGVQLELPPRARGNGPFWTDLPDGTTAPHTDSLIEGLVEAVDSWPLPTARGTGLPTR